MSTEETVYYCYAVARPFPAGDLGGIRGVRGAPVESIAYEDLVAVASPVPAADFTEAALKANLENLSWLEEVARAHNAVVDQVAHQAVTVPFRLATIYWDAERVREVLRADEQPLSAALNRLDGRLEWGVKVYSLEAPSPATTESSSSRSSSAESGRAYLKQRLEQRNSRDDSLQRAEESAVRIDEVLASLAEDRRRHRPQNAELSGAQGQNVFNAAYLVHSSDEQAFADHIARLREEHPRCRVELTGPWVPYSFALDPRSEDEPGE